MSFTIPNTIFGVPKGDLTNDLGAASSLAGGIISGIGALQAGGAQAQGYFNNMQQVGEQEAQQLFQFNRERLAQQYRENALIGKQRAAYGAGGVGASGSPLDVASDTQNQIKLQALNLAYAKRFSQSAAAATGQADLDAAAAAKAAASTGFLGDIIGGIGNAAKLMFAQA